VADEEPLAVLVQQVAVLVDYQQQPLTDQVDKE